MTVEPDLKLEWHRVRIFEKEIAMIFLNIVKEQKEAVVESVTSKENFRSRPLALNTGRFQTKEHDFSILGIF